MRTVTEKQFYTVTAINDCTVTATKNGQTYTLLTLTAGTQGVFQAISNEVQVSDEQAILVPFR